MRRASILALSLALVAVAGLRIGPALTTGAASTTTAAGAGFVGSWRVTITAPGQPPLPGLATFGADGTFLTSNPPVSPANPGGPNKLDFSSTGHGVWQSTGATTAAFTFLAFDADEQGNFLGTATVSGVVTLGADGNSLNGPSSVTVAGPDGKVLFVGGGTVSGTRITVLPLATPLATPGATPTS